MCFARLREMLQSEDEQYMRETAARVMTPIERQAKLRERAKELKAKREGERQAFVQEKLEQQFRYACNCFNHNRKLLISRAPTKVKSQEPAYSQALNQNKIDRQRSRSKESGRQTVRRLWWMVFGVETGRESCA